MTEERGMADDGGTKMQERREGRVSGRWLRKVGKKMTEERGMVDYGGREVSQVTEERGMV